MSKGATKTRGGGAWARHGGEDWAIRFETDPKAEKCPFAPTVFAMSDAVTKPIFLSQNRLADLLVARDGRVRHYAAILDRRLAEAAAGETRLRVPAASGLFRRLPGRPFHGDPEWFFQEAGTLRFELPEERLVLGAGEVALIPAGMSHGERWEGRFSNVILMIQPDGFSLHLGYLDGGIRCGPADRFAAPADRLAGYSAELAALAGEGGREADAIRRGLVLAFLGRVRAALERQTPASVVEPTLLRRCEALIETHHARQDFSVEWLAENLGCTPDHLSRVFRRHHGRRLIEAMHDRRIARAREMLRGTTLGVAEVAWACGYARPSYFNRMFRLRTGMTPRAFAVAKVGAEPLP